MRDEDIDLETDEIGGKLGEAFQAPARVSLLDDARSVFVTR